MKGYSFSSIEKLCGQLLRSSSSRVLVDRTLSDGIRQRTLDKDTLPMLVQRLAKQNGGWVLALQVLESSQLDRHHIRRDENIWKIVERSVPPAGNKAATDCLKRVYARVPVRKVADNRFSRGQQ